jgi:hypothetical protein
VVIRPDGVVAMITERHVIIFFSIYTAIWAVAAIWVNI